MTFDPQKIGKIYGPFKNVSYIESNSFIGVFTINLDNYSFIYDDKKECCERVTTNFNYEQRIIPEKLEYFYFENPGKNYHDLLYTSYSCSKYHIYFVHSDDYVLIYELCNYYSGYYPHCFMLEKDSELIFSTFV